MCKRCAQAIPTCPVHSSARISLSDRAQPSRESSTTTSVLLLVNLGRD